MEKRTNKSAIIEKVMEKNQITRKQAKQITEVFFEGIKGALINGEHIEIRGFGSFTLRHYKAYQGRNPKTGESVQVQPKKQPFFKASKDMRTRVNTL